MHNVISKCYAPKCGANAEAYWFAIHGSGLERNYIRCRVHRPKSMVHMFDRWSGQCVECFDSPNKSREGLCRMFEKHEPDSVNVQLSANDLRTLMGALSALDLYADVPVDEFPFPRRALYARLRTELERLEGRR